MKTRCPDCGWEYNSEKFSCGCKLSWTGFFIHILRLVFWCTVLVVCVVLIILLVYLIGLDIWEWIK